MIKIAPFKAIRPTRDKASLVASRSYLTYSRKTLKEKLDNNPYTFLHIINPDFSDKIKVNNEDLKYQLIKNKFSSFLNQGILQKDNQKCFYLYQQQKKNLSYTGIIAGASIEAYLSGQIKIHEHTISKREKMFCDYLGSTNFNAEPVLLTYKNNEVINNHISNHCKQRPEYEFTTTNKVTHKLWLISKSEDIESISNEFEKVESFYIADGHHRMSSSALLHKKSKTKSSGYCMSFLVSDNQISVQNFNRLVSDLNGLSNDEFLKKLEKSFIVTKKLKYHNPTLKDEISIYLDKSWYSLIYKQKKNEVLNIVEQLDPSILTENILSPILGITDLKTDKRIDFIDGTKLNFAVNEVNSKRFKVLFVLKPISIETIKNVSDNNLCMPPKSTFIEPKLRSGLTIYKFD